jgi:hypothetical protein
VFNFAVPCCCQKHGIVELTINIGGVMIDRTVENVNGIVIGDITNCYVLISPNGTEYARTSAYSSMSEAKPWALSIIEKTRAELGAEESHRLALDKPWEIREYL